MVLTRGIKWPPGDWNECDLYRDDESRLPTQLYPFSIERERDDRARQFGPWRLFREKGNGLSVKLGQHDDVWTAFRAMLDAYQAWHPTRPLSVVYFIGTKLEIGRSLKIGYSLQPEARLRTLQTASSEPLRIFATTPGGKREEEAYHRRWRARRGMGEWFTIGDCIIKEIERLAA